MRLLLLFLLSFIFSFSETLRVACASSFRFAFEEIKKAFERTHGTKLLITYGASGHFYIQIKNGAPYDVFISANELYPKKLIEEGKAVKDSYTVFSKGILTLFTLKNLDLSDYNVLASKDVGKIAIANPKHAPYGKAALAFLKNTGLYDKVKEKLVYGSNVSQAFQYVVTGGADVGLVALSLVLPFGKGRYRIIEQELYPEIRNVAVLTLRAKEKQKAWDFVRFLLSDEAKKILKRYGFALPEDLK
ncbi:MAG: molybdate ABC transporter substrate-binding protein [Aquificae bacterium]|nr:molybdate ABC transporter substrate-binding protein [Aquificota bacterium]